MVEQNEKSSETFGSDHSNRRHRVDIQQMMDKQSIRRRLLDKIATGAVMACVIAALIPLGSILIEVVKNGSGALSLEFLTQPPGAIGSGSGGIGPALQGTLIVIALASLIGAPAGVLAGIYLSEFAGSGRFPYAIRFLNDVLTGLPSIVVGIVGFVVIVLTIGSFSVWAGAFALSIIMVPIVVRVTEETLKLVPNSIREAGYSLGIPKWKVVMFIVLTSAKSGVLTGIVLALSRISGETAPLIMTILGTSLFFTGFADPVDALPLRIWRLASQPYESAHSFGWGAALILIILVLAMSVGLRMLAYKKGFRIKTMSI
jgi:phosphate transport system permease protein